MSAAEEYVEEAAEATEEVETGQQVEADDVDEHGDTEADRKKASELGWKPPAKFKGSPDKFISAKKFLSWGETSLPLLKSEVKELRDKLEKMRSYYDAKEARAIERALKEAQEARELAVEVGDKAAFKRHDEEVQKLISEKPDQVDKHQEEFVEWQKDNEWSKDKRARSIAAGIADEISEEEPGLSLTQVLNKVAKQMKKEFPQFFPEEKPAKALAASVESGRAPVRKAGKSYNDLPADVRAVCDKNCKEMYHGKPLITRDQWVKDYFGE